MWKIEFTKNGESNNLVWSNGHKDDFARFLPGQLGVKKEELKLFRLDKGQMEHVNVLLSEVSEGKQVNEIDYSEEGKVKVLSVTDNTVKFETTGEKVLWSEIYDDDMNFILK